MFPKENRLHSKKEIDHHYKVAKHVRSGPLLISISPRPSEQSRFVVIASKKFDLRATQRNRQKRIIRQALRDFVERRNIGEGCDISVAYTKPGKMLSYGEVTEILRESIPTGKNNKK